MKNERIEVIEMALILMCCEKCGFRWYRQKGGVMINERYIPEHMCKNGLQPEVMDDISGKV
jgi:hypothetical protein